LGDWFGDGVLTFYRMPIPSVLEPSGAFSGVRASLWVIRTENVDCRASQIDSLAL
jgi:hypothetical protein